MLSVNFYTTYAVVINIFRVRRRHTKLRFNIILQCNVDDIKLHYNNIIRKQFTSFWLDFNVLMTMY